MGAAKPALLLVPQSRGLEIRGTLPVWGDLHQIRKEITAMKVRPLHDRILLKRIEEKESVKGGIIIPDTAKEKPQEAVVVAVGNGKILENGTKLTLEVKEGDHVLFGKYSGSEIKVDGEEYLIVREDDVLGILAESAKSKASK
jgi:chaperonin GroES